MRRALDEKLRARAPVERVTAVRADLRVDPEAPQDGERPTRHGAPRGRGGTRAPAAEEMHRAGRVEERGDLREPVAAALGASAASSARASEASGRAHSSVPSSASSRRLSPCARGAVAAERERLVPPRCDDAMAGDDERQAVRRAEAPCGAGGTRSAGEGREPAVRDHLAPRERPRRGEQLALERAEPLTRPRPRRRTRPPCRRGGPRTAGTDPARSRHAPVTGWPLA